MTGTKLGVGIPGTATPAALVPGHPGYLPSDWLLLYVSQPVFKARFQDSVRRVPVFRAVEYKWKRVCDC